MAQGCDDFRVHVGFPRHLKTRRLRAALGADGVLALLTLWAYAADNHPDGDLGGLDAASIELAAEWTGEPLAFVRTCLLIGWLDTRQDDDEDGTGPAPTRGDGGTDPNGDGTVTLHDWAEHQPFLVERAKRVARSRKANEAKRRKAAAERRRKPRKQASPRSTYPVTDPVTYPVTGKETYGRDSGLLLGDPPPTLPPSHLPTIPPSSGGARKDAPQGEEDPDLEAIAGALSGAIGPTRVSLSTIASAAEQVLAEPGIDPAWALRWIQTEPLRGVLPFTARTRLLAAWREHRADELNGPLPCPGCGDRSPPALTDTRAGLRCPTCIAAAEAAEEDPTDA